MPLNPLAFSTNITRKALSDIVPDIQRYTTTKMLEDSVRIRVKGISGETTKNTGIFNKLAHSLDSLFHS